ncbi:MAG: type III-B CRISPR module RAMP protein Cmr6 [Bacteroidetes bacterium]|nr:type III-B CRISPR module RAMP protein Cmr6 [Bacteroidota bacterium]
MAGQNLAGPFLPKTTQRLVRLDGDNPYFPLEQRQLGLHLDKFTRISEGNEKAKKEALDDVVQIEGSNELLKNLLARRTTVLEKREACRVEMKTAGPLTLHISRAGAWENAGICLHPVYGFAYIPGSGIKGLVRSWAETVWAQDQENKETTWNRIDDLFGYSTNSESHKFVSSKRDTPGWRPDGINPKHPTSTGRLVFHDAWPKVWPRLEVDIANNHHTEYYKGDDGPGDWEKPVLIYFLCVRSGTFFEFAISDRKPGGADAIELASSWLVNALQTNGAGAKTAAGYGRFLSVSSPKLSVPTVLRSREHELELVSPAFLAGANQKQKDCDLRGATLRGLLRWWWRAMYAGKIDLKTLRMLETAIWGGVKSRSPVHSPIKNPKKKDESGSPVHIAVRRMPGDEPRQYTESKDFLRNTTTLGLNYTTYGMAESKENRWYRPEKTRWKIVFTVRDTWIHMEEKPGMKLAADEVERQASAALWLLCRYGGVGAKSRKGFGSLADISLPGVDSWEDCSKLAKDLATKCGIQTARQKPYGPSLDTALFVEDLPTECDDPRRACNMIGETLKAAVKSLSRRDRPALGMPRERADQERFRQERHASPVLWSLSRRSDGKLSVRLLAFPSPRLPNADESKKILSDFVKQVKIEVLNRSRKSATGSRKRLPEKKHVKTDSSNRNRKPESTLNLGGPPANGDVVEAEILHEKTQRGKLKAKHIESGWIGHIIDTTSEDVKPGQIVKLYVHAIHENTEGVTFKWMVPKKTKPDKSRSNKSKHPRGRRKRHR